MMPRCLLVPAFLLLAACDSSQIGVRRFATTSCGSIGSEGCCAGNQLWWCEADALRRIDCEDRPSCGWRESGLYDCDTAGSADPKGVYPRTCNFGDAGTPFDGGSIDGNGCGPIGGEGCCAGEVLGYCERGALIVVSCANNPRCGWQAGGQLYNCGTSGGEDPLGVYRRDCGAALPDGAGPAIDEAVDSGPGDGPDDRPDASIRNDSGATDPDVQMESGCSCEQRKHRAVGGLPACVVLVLLLGSRAKRSTVPTAGERKWRNR